MQAAFDSGTASRCGAVPAQDSNSQTLFVVQGRDGIDAAGVQWRDEADDGRHGPRDQDYAGNNQPVCRRPGTEAMLRGMMKGANDVR
ncbi:MAG TPA: hypothetical protein VJQ54_19105 [Candidatus Sulfotelmatobacter sp.]|nr:hypothetical protein [Candidatus Sulfotelmatobacter sp.]